jgi:hypothetical protein
MRLSFQRILVQACAEPVRVTTRNNATEKATVPVMARRRITTRRDMDAPIHKHSLDEGSNRNS